MRRKVFILLLLPLLFNSCASYTSKTKPALEAFDRRDFQAAENVYASGAAEEGVDQLVYLFESGTVRYTAGKYKESIKDFLFADKLSEIKDYTALATEVATVLTNDRITHYKGEEFEHVLVSVYLALNYALLGKQEDAIVECRRVNRKLERLRGEGKRNYKLNAFAQYLSGVLYEKERNWNSAYVDYKKTYEILPKFSSLPKDLVRGALEVDSSSDLRRWRKTFSLNDVEIKSWRKEMGEKGSVILLLQNGLAPEKIVSPSWYELPEYQKRYNRHRGANLYLNGEKVATTELLFDVEEAAVENLKEKFATYLLKRAAGVVAREVIGNQLDKKHEGLGTVVKIAMYAASQPDLRSWLTLPKDFQVARAWISPGRYQASLRMVTMSGSEEGDKPLGEIEIKKPGQVLLLQYRSLND